jgi:putative transposase
MGEWLRIGVWSFVSLLRSRQDLALENVALRQQWMVLRRQPGHVRLKDSDRLFWVWLHRLWPGWRQALVLVQPATVVDWHRRGFRAYWRWKSRARGGRPRIDPSVRQPIRHMWSSNPTCGAPRIQAELRKIGIEVSDSTIRRYRPPRVGPSSQTWRSFLDNHLADLAAIDFSIVPPGTFRVLYVLLIMSHDRRRILHFNVTTSPSARWTARQVVEAFPYESSPRFLLRDRDKIFGSTFVRRVEWMGIEEVVTAPGSPWQNPYCERLIGSIRRECLDHVVVLGERRPLRFSNQPSGNLIIPPLRRPPTSGKSAIGPR